MGNRILILGASGFIGNYVYRELLPYFEVFGTYCHQNRVYQENHVFSQYCVEDDNLPLLLNKIKPGIIISALIGNFKDQLKAHRELCEYAENTSKCRILYFSAAEVFDGANRFPAYENDRPLAESDCGKFKIAVEKLLLERIPKQIAILRLPLVLGINSPKVQQLRQATRHKAVFEVFPNLIVSVTTVNKISQQLHYIINKKLTGIFHLASNDMVHHEELFREIASKTGNKIPIFKSVYSSNDDSYLAILPKKNRLPLPYQTTVAKVIEECTLKEEFETLKKN